MESLDFRLGEFWGKWIICAARVGRHPQFQHLFLKSKTSEWDDIRKTVYATAAFQLLWRFSFCEWY